MAVPTPQTPSTIYGTVKITADQTIFVELRGNKFLTVEGALSRSYIDVPYYDGGNYRDTVDAALMGRGGVSIMKVTSSGTVPTPITTVINGDLEVLDGSVTATVTVQPDEILTMIQEDDNFTHTAPHPELHARTKVQWWDNAVPASGNEIVWMWLDRIEGCSTRIPQSNGSVPPVFTP